VEPSSTDDSSLRGALPPADSCTAASGAHGLPICHARSGMRSLPSQQRPPTAEEEARDPEHGGDDVDGDEHAEKKCVIDKGRGGLVDRNR
jgi:hypothetical protein